jgi:hypothetical protein
MQGILRSRSASTGEIAHQIAKNIDVDFKTADMFLYRLLRDQSFQIDDSIWRCHCNMVFDFLREKEGLKNGDNININMDYTTIEDDFLILTASINIAKEKGVVLFFTTRLYPKRKRQMDQKKMELAFFKGLKHILPKKYTYTIVADRGFGHLRIIEICDKLKFNYVLRTNCDLTIITADKEVRKLMDYKGKTEFFTAYVKRWKRYIRFDVRTENNETWYILTSFENQGGAKVYAMRFKVEKAFQDMKSSGYDIEKTKIRKYDRFKRLLFMISVCHAISTFLGFFVKYCKKNFTNHWESLIAYSNME